MHRLDRMWPFDPQDGQNFGWRLLNTENGPKISVSFTTARPGKTGGTSIMKKYFPCPAASSNADIMLLDAGNTTTARPYGAMLQLALATAKQNSYELQVIV